MTHRYTEALGKNIVAIAVMVIVASFLAGAQTLVDTVTVGDQPVAVAINPNTNKVYVVNQDSNNITVIDGLTLSTNTVLTGTAPDALAVNPATNTIYVSNADSNTVTVVNGTMNRTASVPVGDYPIAIAVNPVTNKIYVANNGSNTLTVIDGANNLTSTIGPWEPAGAASHPYAVAVNSASNKIYVADNGSNDVAIVNGVTGSVTTVAVGVYPTAIAIDEVTDKIYVVNYGSNNVSVIDGTGNLVVGTVTVGTSPAAVAVNPVTAKVYVSNSGNGTATVIDEATLHTTTVATGASPIAVDVDPVTNKIYLGNFVDDGAVTMIDGTTDNTTSVLLGNPTWPSAIVVNWVTNTIYAANRGGNTVSVIAGAISNALQFVPVTPCRVADTRLPQGPFGGPYLAGGTSRSFVVPQNPNCSIPASATAYSLNVTVVPVQRSLNYLTIWPTGEAQPNISTLNSYDGRIKANAAIVPAGAGGAVSVYVTDPANVILDINGYFQVPGSGTLQFYKLPPCRVVDTRRGAQQPQGLGPPSLGNMETRDLSILSSPCLSGIYNAAAYSFNVTVVPNPPTQPLNFLTVWPSDQPQPSASTLNNPTATVVANAAIVPAAPNGHVDVFAYNSTDVIMDINGYFGAPGGTDGLSLYTTGPCRVIDTRSSGGTFSGKRNPPVSVAASQCGISSAAQEYVFNATAVPVGVLGYLTLWADGTTMPSVSTLNATDGMVASNLAVVGTEDGEVDAYAYGLTYLILDISTYFAP